MGKKIFLQLILALSIIIISVVFYSVYFVEKKTINENLKSVKAKKEKLNKKKSNLIHNIEYTSQDAAGNSYIITSEIGELKDDQPELILMKSVKAEINLLDSTPISISADNAIYNNVNYNTNFYGNVLITYTDHIIQSNNFDLDFEKDIGIIYDNIIYKNLNTKLEADKIEIDLITKNSKIFMNKKSKKIKITNIN
jgi:lipopolysaccharide assembly outer membrane protein LptD (OstA)